MSTPRKFDMEAKKPNAYALAGVDFGIEAEASRIMDDASKETWKNRQGLVGEIVIPFDDGTGPKMVSGANLPEGTLFSVSFDTAGTKVEIAERVGIHDTIAYDLFAMVCDAAVVRGGEPVLVGSTLDIKSLGTDERYLPIVRELAKGYIAAAEEANVAVINGNIAQMGTRMCGYGNFPYHWSAACVWFARKETLFTGTEIQSGDAIVALREYGFRANGWSLVRKIFREAHGEDWHTAGFGESTLGLAALTPSVIYSRAVVGLHGGYQSEGSCRIHGVVHITSGGVSENMLRVLRPSGFGAKLIDLFDPPEVMAYAQKTGQISDHDAYRAWNMGQGMALITPEPDKVITKLQGSGIEARIAGEVTKKHGVCIVSRGTEARGTVLTFDEA